MNAWKIIALADNMLKVLNQLNDLDFEEQEKLREILEHNTTKESKELLERFVVVDLELLKEEQDVLEDNWSYGLLGLLEQTHRLESKAWARLK